MNAQLAGARWTVAVYSSAYFDSHWCTNEWTAALARKTLLPVRVEPVIPPETLRTLTWVDLFDQDEPRARAQLLRAVGLHVLPRLAVFPGRPAALAAFPGPGPGQQPGPDNPADRLMTAQDHLAQAVTLTRLAGVRAIQRLVDDHPADLGILTTAADVLAAHIRSTSIPTRIPDDVAAALPALRQLSGIPRDLTGAQLARVDLHDADLTKIIFIDVNLALANLRGVDLTGVQLNRANLRGVDLTDARLRGADLTGARLRRVDLTDVNLAGAQLDKVDFAGARLTGLDFAGARLAGVDLTGADLTDTALAGANLAGAQLAGLDFTGARLDRVDLSGANLIGAQLHGADLIGADLSGAKLNGGDFTGARLTGVDLTGADLANTRLAGADLTGADLTSAYLVGVNLTDTVGLTQTQVDAARGNVNTRLPVGLVRPPHMNGIY
ncbi:pentapeptide repeat protein [Candidatus Protofrankia datiscae]|uniref:Pentapeptide repeat protein n=1 Tax=Candidatus Protofrankia datiscae TaxID=2716812 RepID=F8B0C3_9ACTN|nr:pentapeptide repeat-containing protein [Candidatus Protofrankia datiscae]AEH08748.1 pentapeptide repeat protein [Candidatus Protofrankia datiscae]